VFRVKSRDSLRVVFLVSILIVVFSPVMVRADDHYNFVFNIGLISHDHVTWALSSGDGIYGDFEVTYPASGADQIITFFICDEDTYNEWVGGGSLSGYHLQENVGSYSFEFRIPYTDTWHFVFKNYALLTTKTVEFDVSRDTTPPAIDMNLDAGATYSGIKEITATVTEATFSISEVKLYIDGTLKDTEYDSSFSYSWDTTQYSNGAHTVRIWASDNVGNGDYEEVIVEISNIVPDTTTTTTDEQTGTDGQTGQTMGMDPLLFLGLIGLVAIVAVVALLSRRREGPPPAGTIPSIPPTPPSEKQEPEIIREREIIKERVLLMCPFCSAKVEQGVVFCPNCGGKM